MSVYSTDQPSNILDKSELSEITEDFNPYAEMNFDDENNGKYLY